MIAIHVRNLETAVAEALKERARRHHRSLDETYDDADAPNEPGAR